MISNFFVLSPRGDTIIAKQYRNDRGDAGAHERSHTEAFFRKVKFWDDREDGTTGTSSDNANGGSSSSGDNGSTEDGPSSSTTTGDAPPAFMMPDGLTYLHVKRNGLIFGCATARNVSAVTVIEVRNFPIFFCHNLVILRTNFRIHFVFFKIDKNNSISLFLFYLSSVEKKNLFEKNIGNVNNDCCFHTHTHKSS
jgi:hypothetical protein